MDILPLDQQKKAILYAPKDLLWKIVEEEGAWLKLFKVLPDDYYNHFLTRLRLVGADESSKIKTMAKVYVRDKVRLDHLQESICKIWNPSCLEDATSWMKENGFLDRPLAPINLHADYKEVIREAKAMPKATRMRLARSAGGKAPKAGSPPEGASRDSAKCWNRVLRDKKRRKMILRPKSVQDQWSLAINFWTKECANRGIAPYKGSAGGSSKSRHGTNTLSRSMRELISGLQYEQYTMSRPASRKLKSLFLQLQKDGYDLGKWESIRPKRRRGM